MSSQGSHSRKTSLSPTSPTFMAAAANEPGISRTNLKVSFKERLKNLQKESAKETEKVGSGESSESKQHLIPSTSTAKPKRPSASQQLRDKIKSFGQIPKDELTPWSKLKLATVVSLGGSYSSLNNSITGDSPKLSKTTKKSSMPVNLNAVNKLDGSLVARNEYLDLKSVEHKTSVSDSELKSETAEISAKVRRKPRPFKLMSEPKDYRSVDDLSPEYSGLPFVKKLKILNERQKLAELESAIQTRSFSLDCTDSSNSNEMVEVLTRSHSEASCMVARPKPNTLSSAIVPVAPLNLNSEVPIKSPLSPESNETLERKQLKSILKRLSEDRLAQNVDVKNAERPADMKKLMRAQTVEGYVARRTKFTKSVTFNNTLSSPPNSAPLTEEQEDSAKSSPPVPFSIPASSSPRPSQALYPISNAQETPTSLDKTPTQFKKSTDADQSTNRFNFPDNFMTASSTETTLKTNPESTALTPKPNINIDDPSRSLSFVSDEPGLKKIVKGIEFISIVCRLLFLLYNPINLFSPCICNHNNQLIRFRFTSTAHAKLKANVVYTKRKSFIYSAFL